MAHQVEDAAPRAGGRRPGLPARYPRHITAAGWLVVLRRVAARVVPDRFPLFSAAVAFFAVLSVAPVLITALSVYGAVNTPARAMEHLSGLAGVLPPALGDVLADQLTSITAASTSLLTVRGLTALAVALWTAMTAMSFLIDALTVAYREQETRRLPHRVCLALAFVLAGALVLGAVITGSALVSRALAGVPAPVRAVALALVWLALAVLMAVALAVLYRYAPNRRHARSQWRWLHVGATAATVVWLAASAGLFSYVQNLGTYERTYGSLAGVAVSMLWLWLTVLLVITGAAVNAEAERHGRDGRPDDRSG